MGLDRLGAYTRVENRRSEAALRGAGFRHEGVLRRWHRDRDGRVDVGVWSLLGDELQASPLAAVPVEIRGRVPPALAAARSGATPT
jgi:hypothetical protein